MPYVMDEDGVEVHIYEDSPERIVHACDGDMDSGIEVEIDLNTGLVTGYGPTSKLPTEEFLWEALRVVRKHRAKLKAAWDEINS
jgi:hypothetical protein